MATMATAPEEKVKKEREKKQTARAEDHGDSDTADINSNDGQGAAHSGDGGV